MENKLEIIETFITNFIQKDKRQRCFLELTNPKKRSKFVDKLNHKWESILDMRFLTKVEKGNDYADKIKQLLNFNEEELCYIISNYTEFDDKFLPFGTVFNKIYTKGFASIIINSTGDKIFLDTEQIQGHTPRFIGKK